MHISVIVTVKNEGESLRPFLDSLIKQTYQPDEIVITDGGSTDDTVAILQAYDHRLPLRVIPLPDSNISRGRNYAIMSASSDIIAVTDAGVILDPRWLEEITHPIRTNQTAVVSGWFEADAYTSFEVVMGATVLPARHNINPDTFLPSSRSIAFTKSVWEQVGGYPEWLDYCEDLLFDLALRKQVGSFSWAADAIVYFRPRTSLAAFWKQYYLYARGDGKADLWRKRHAIRYIVYLVILPILLKKTKQGGLGLLALPITMMAGFIYCLDAVKQLDNTIIEWPLFAKMRAFATIPLIRFVGDSAKMIGYPIGVLWRWKTKKQQ